MKQQSLFVKISYLFATVFGSGYSPYAPGTVGSFFAALFFLLLKSYSILFLASLIICLFFLGVFVANQVAQVEHCKDPSIVVIDELVGIWITFLFILIYKSDIYNSFFGYSLLFILFRFFDIIKPYPIKHAEKYSGGFGIMIDDVIAALYTILVALIIDQICF